MTIIRKIFKFLSSVKLAVPLMIVIIFVVSYGTIVESMYNSDMARLKVYHTNWFTALMTLLWFNILFAALSRWPWKKHHIGFLITHLGLLLLLFGGVLTTWWGIDGSLRIVEGEESNAVVLPHLVLGIAPPGASSYSFYPLNRTDKVQDISDFANLNKAISSVLTIDKMEPFVEIKTGYQGTKDSSKGPFAVEFRIKSAFFDVEQSLQSETQQSVAMGPAQFLLKEETGIDSNSNSDSKSTNANNQKPRQPNQDKPIQEKKVQTKKASNKFKKGNWLIVKDKGTEKVLKEIEVNADLVEKTITIKDVKITITKIFKSASVGQGGVTDNPGGEPNPALIVMLESGSDKARDVIFAKYPTFSLNQKNNFGLSFEFQSSELKVENIVAETEPKAGSDSKSKTDTTADVPMHGGSSTGGMAMGESAAGAPPPMATMGKASNQMEFYFNRSKPDVVKLVLSKNGEKVQTTEAKIGDTITTPWMGMQVTIKGLHWGAQMKNEVLPTVPELKANFLPPSALLISPALSAPADQDWLVEGDEKSIVVNDKGYNIYFGRQVEFLPFKLKLGKFKKVDYPGTTMAKSFESLVTVSDTQKDVLISMNEPLEHRGYTVYQSSYEEMPGGMSASIFSVNKDPGRPFKYFGGIILALGIIVFTVMRSRWYLKRSKA